MPIFVPLRSVALARFFQFGVLIVPWTYFLPDVVLIIPPHRPFANHYSHSDDIFLTDT